MGKIKELFGAQAKEVVDKLPNKELRKSISSGNYGYSMIVSKQNPLFIYLVDPTKDKNIVYWHDKIVHNLFRWTEMHKYFTSIGLVRTGGFHPYNYGVGSLDCADLLYECGNCHKSAIEAVYNYYRKKNK